MDWKSSGECARLMDSDVVTLYGKQRGGGGELHGCSRNSRRGGFGAAGTCWEPAAWRLAARCSW